MIDAINLLETEAESRRSMTPQSQQNERLADQFELAAEVLRQMHNRAFSDGIIAGVKLMAESCKARRAKTETLNATAPQPCPRCTELEAEKDSWQGRFYAAEGKLAEYRQDTQTTANALGHIQRQLEEVSQERDDWIACHAKIFRELQETKALLGNKCAELEQMRSTLQWIQDHCAGDALPRWENTPQTGHSRGLILDHTNYALSLPDLASPVLNKVKADALRDAANEFGRRWTQAAMVQKELRAMADAIEKGEG